MELILWHAGKHTILHNVADDAHIIEIAPSAFGTNIFGH